MTDDISKEVQDWFDWRETENRKHRTMGIHEYRMWCHVGDSISHPSNLTALRGGLTIDFSGKNYSHDPRIIGTTAK